MKKHKITVKNIHDYSVVSKLYIIASECCSCNVVNKIPEITFTFSSESDKNCFEQMVKSLRIFSKYKI
jgi:hypothetical protein